MVDKNKMTYILNIETLRFMDTILFTVYIDKELIVANMRKKPTIKTVKNMIGTKSKPNI